MALSRYVVVQRLHVLRNVQKSVMHVQSCCFANPNLFLFCRSRCPRRRRCLSILIFKPDQTALISGLSGVWCLPLPNDMVRWWTADFKQVPDTFHRGRMTSRDDDVYYPDLDSASDWLKICSILRKTVGRVVKCRLFSQALIQFRET